MKSKVPILLFIIFFIPFVLSAQVVEVQQQPAQPEEKGMWAKTWDIITSPLFLGIIFFIFVVTGIIILIILGIGWLIKYIKSQNDIFFKIRKERISLAKAHSRFPAKHWWKIEKNTPVHLVRMENGKPVITKPIGYHRGDYTTPEGNENIAISIPNRKKFFVLPDTELLVIPNRNDVKVETISKNGTKEEITINNLPLAKDIVQFNENQILIYADSISSTGTFLVPVLKTKEGKIVDLTLPVYATLKEVALNDYLFQQSDDFVKVSRRAVDMNPSIRGAQKLTDSNQSVDVNTQENNT